MVIFISGFVIGVIATLIFVRWLAEWAAVHIVGNHLW